MQRAHTHTCKQTYLKPSSFTVMSKGDQKNQPNKTPSKMKNNPLKQIKPQTNKKNPKTNEKKPKKNREETLLLLIQ